MKQQITAVNNVPSYLEPFRKEALDLVNKYAKQFYDEVYIVAFFFAPKYRKVATSKKFSLQDITKFTLKIASAWGMPIEGLRNLGIKKYF